MEKPNVINALEVEGFSPPGAEGKYSSRLVICDESVGANNIVLNHFTLLPGQKIKLASHPEPYEEVYYILHGEGELVLDDPQAERKPVHANSAVYIPAGKLHQLVNTGDEPIEMLCIMPFHPTPGVNPVYDARIKAWGSSFKLNDN